MIMLFRFWNEKQKVKNNSCVTITCTITNRRSLCVMPPLSSLATMIANTLLASLAKSRSRTSWGETGTTAKASLSSLTAAHPTYDNISQTAT